MGQATETLIDTLKKADCEATAAPWWMIVNPQQNMRCDLAEAAFQITGPYFSREDAEEYLKNAKHNFSGRAQVWCASGCYSKKYEKFYKEIMKEAKTTFDQGWTGLDRKEGELSREEAMVAYCSGKKIRVIDTSSAHDSDYDAWLIEQTPWVQFGHGSYPGKIPLFMQTNCCFEIVPEPLVLVDGLEACKAYREGKTIRRNSRNHKTTDCGNHPNFAVDGWEVID
jgi:hypothetical protein